MKSVSCIYSTFDKVLNVLRKVKRGKVGGYGIFAELSFWVVM